MATDQAATTRHDPVRTTSLGGRRVLELSHTVLPGAEEYHLSVRSRPVTEFLPFYAGKTDHDAWYVMSEVELWSHVGTHLEAPLHAIREGADVSAVDLGRVVGAASLIDLHHKRPGDAITEADLRDHGAHVEVGDIVFVRTDSGFYGTDRSHDRPHFSLDAILWLADDRHIKLLGVDCSGFEDRERPGQPLHRALFSRGIPVIEHLAHLDQLRSSRFDVITVPWRVVGLDASPVSVIAIEPPLPA